MALNERKLNDALQSFRVAHDAELSQIPGPYLSAYTNLPLKIAILSGCRTLYIHKLHEKYVQNIKRDLGKYGSSDVMKQWTLMTTDILGSLAFGQSFGNTKNEEKNQMVRDVEAVMPIIGVRAELPWTKPIFNVIPSWLPLGLNALWERFNEYGEEAVRATRAAQAGGNKTLFSRMVLDDKNAQDVPDSLIVQEAANVITAGTDTTAMTLTYLVYTVLKHEEVEQKLIRELTALPPDPEFDQLNKLSYLQNVIQEVMRLHPAVPGSLPRIVPAGGGRLGKYTIPAGTQVSTQAWTLQRDGAVFPDPLKFDPDRWNDPTPAMKEHMLVFGGSARICLGQNIARLTLAHAVSTLFRECADITLAPETTEESMEMVDYFAIKPKAQKCVIVPTK
ncbi:hypothetical protein E8E12_000483 [Didymella heteroderae]|uniref:Cytochrome P450 n=1 Tax=Didymella heteroderae TaxID=1769908 RepID=A0A9P4WIT7_9PLEO|nr:hypothetical protein E8E12_000483 [Didymella heteroderae]